MIALLARAFALWALYHQWRRRHEAAPVNEWADWLLAHTITPTMVAANAITAESIVANEITWTKLIVLPPPAPAVVAVPPGVRLQRVAGHRRDATRRARR